VSSSSRSSSSLESSGSAVNLAASGADPDDSSASSSSSSSSSSSHSRADACVAAGSPFPAPTAGVHQAWLPRRPEADASKLRLTRRQLRQLGRGWTLEEVRQHTAPTDAWIAVNGRVSLGLRSRASFAICSG
jgi:hypothetical protein